MCPRLEKTGGHSIILSFFLSRPILPSLYLQARSHTEPVVCAPGLRMPVVILNLIFILHFSRFSVTYLNLFILFLLRSPMQIRLLEPPRFVKAGCHFYFVVISNATSIILFYPSDYAGFWSHYVMMCTLLSHRGTFLTYASTGDNFYRLWYLHIDTGCTRAPNVGGPCNKSA